MNGPWLLAGVLLVFLSVAHAVWGARRVFPAVPDTLQGETRLSLAVPWHQMTVALLLMGLSVLLATVQPEMRAAAGLVLALIIGNLAVFAGAIVASRQWTMIQRTLPQTVLFVILIGLLAAGWLA